MTLVVDAGHGGTDPGCAHGGLVEKDLTLATALQLRALLDAAGFSCVVTRSGDDTLSLSERGRRSRAARATQVIALHFDASSSPKAGQLTCYAVAGDSQSQQLATAVMATAPSWLQRCRSIVCTPNNWTRRAHNVVGAHAAPALLVECAFLTNPDHVVRLRTREGIVAIASSLLAALSQTAADVCIR